MTTENKYDVIIIGAGASGLMCAYSAGTEGKKVLIIEHQKKVGNKIKISGGGKCNFTNLSISSNNYISGNPHFCKSALSRFTPYDFISILEEHNIIYEEREFSQLFCKDSSKEIINLLLKLCSNYGVKIQTSCKINNIKNISENSFLVATQKEKFYCQSLVMATGGLSFKSVGATDFGIKVAENFHLKINKQRPGLVPLTLKITSPFNINLLAGISLPVKISCDNQYFTSSLLFTHKGISGPAVLQISNYWKVGSKIIIDFLPQYNLAEQIQNWKLNHPLKNIANLFSTLLPKKLVDFLLGENNHPIKTYNEKSIIEIIDKIQKYELIPTGTEGYKKAEVTIGGVCTDEISSKSFESKKIKGLFFIGELLDVTGWLGGYNLHWAWASGYCAGKHV